LLLTCSPPPPPPPRIAEQDDECDTVDKFSIFIDWLHASGGNHEQLTLQKYADEMRGVHATRDVAPDETICTIPLKCLITVEMGKSTEVGRKVSMHNLQLDAPKHVYVMLFMLMDMQEPESFFRPYYDVLPETLNSMPVFWSEEELSWLQGSYMVSQTRDRKDAIARDYRNICGIAPEFESAVTLQQFIWARMIVCSRNFGIIVNGLRTSAMVPYADMLNHLRPRECKWEFEDDIQAFTITSLEHMKAGAQVYDSYGKKCNYRFLLNYGFALENNIEADGSSPNEFSVCFDESRSGATDPLAEERFGLWRVLPPMQQVHSKRLRLDANVRSAPARQAFAILRVLNANAAEIAHMKAPAATPEFPSRRRPSAQEPMSLRNEIAMLHALRDLMASMLAAYPRTLEEDDKMLAEDTTLEPFSNRRHALLLVRGEKQVLRYFADFASKCLEVLVIESPVERGAAAARLTGQQDRPSQAAGVHLNEDLGAMLSSDTAEADFRSFEELIRPGVPSAAEGESVDIGGGLAKRVIRQPAGPGSATPPTEFCTVAAHYR
jgi:histone-lysine N-methyltransferase SETD3